MSQRILHQFLTGATAGDAITDHALLIQSWLQELGFASEIYGWHLHPSMESSVRPMAVYRRGRGEAWGIYHHSIGSDMPDFLLGQGMRLILIYHNITPPEYFDGSDPLRAHLARLGQRQLQALRPATGLALAVSRYNESELREAGYADTDVMPLCLRAERYEAADLPTRPDTSGPRLLFIGRLAPNKRQEDLVKLLFCLRRARPAADLVLVGDRWEVGYDRWVEELAADLGVRDGVILTGKLSQAEMVGHLRAADFYVSMSEHEGFGMPLIESMYLGLPALAYGAAAVPETMGGAGVVFHDKAFEYLAELIDLLADDEALCERLVARQRERAREFLEPQVRARFVELLRQVGLC